MRKREIGEEVCLLDGTRWRVQEVKCIIVGTASAESSNDAEVARIRVEREGEIRWILPTEISR
jgi:hypothetical protein